MAWFDYIVDAAAAAVHDFGDDCDDDDGGDGDTCTSSLSLSLSLWLASIECCIV